MNRIKQRFNLLKEKNQKALVGFVTAGDPDLSTSIDLIKGMCDAGLDFLELGVPFSDPTADGPVIQRSSARAIAKGIHLSDILEMTAELRKTIDIPIILFTYYNPVLAFGVEKFYTAARKAGADGTLVVDLPPEESDELTRFFDDDDGFSLIRLIAPTTPRERMEKISKTASGFLYLVSKTGVTGSDGLESGSISNQMNTLRSICDLPVCIGFGISTPGDVSQIASVADGVVIGSAFERLIENNLTHPELAAIMASQVEVYKAATMI